VTPVLKTITEQARQARRQVLNQNSELLRQSIREVLARLDLEINVQVLNQIWREIREQNL
jgi:polyribonucleotide nucleotidyltransferase